VEERGESRRRQHEMVLVDFYSNMLPFAHCLPDKNSAHNLLALCFEYR
jgi:hypothetical protein